MSGHKTGPCKGLGCTNEIILRNSKSGFCRVCFDKARGETVGARASRLAKGQPTDTDRLRVENVRLRKEANALRRAVDKAEGSRFVEEKLVEVFSDLMRSSPYVQRFEAPPPSRSSAAQEMLSLVSDAHYPEVVDPEACFGVEYNGAICQARMEYLQNKIVRFKQTRGFPVDKLTIGVNGDMLSGDIHEDLEVTNEIPLAESLVRMGQMLYNFGVNCATEFPEVEMIIMPGNHPRVTKKPRAKNKWNNWEWVMGRYVEALSAGQFKVVVPKALVHIQKIFDYRIGMTHGDGVKATSFAGIPHYALKRKRDAFQSMLRNLGQPQIDMLLYGHFHQLIYDQQLGILINGSIKGPDEFAMGTMYAATGAVQALLSFHPEHMMTDLSLINLQNVSA